MKTSSGAIKVKGLLFEVGLVNCCRLLVSYRKVEQYNRLLISKFVFKINPD